MTEALTPRREAPAETLGYLFEDDDGTEWSEADPRFSGENEYATNVRPVTLAMAVAEMRSAWELLSEQREALIQADLKIRSLPGTDQSDVEGLRAVIDAKHEAPADDGPVFHMNLLSHEDNEAWLESARRVAAKHEAPAEGAGEAAIAKLFDAVEMADDYNRLSDRPKRLAKDSLLDSELRDAVSSLRARSSAPEAREEALGNLLAAFRRLRAAAREALAMTLLQWALRIDGATVVDVITRGVRSAR